MTISEIIKTTIANLNEQGIQLTPKNYAQVFCKVAKEQNIKVEDCEELKKYIEKLSPFIREQIKKQNPKDLNEFIIYLISSVNKATADNVSKQNITLITLVKRLLQTITFLHDKEAAKLANISLDRIEYLADLNSFEMIKDKWFDFVTSYDDSYLKKLEPYCKLESNSLKDIIDCVIETMNKSSNTTFLENISGLIIASLNPSIASSVNDELAALSYDLKSSPILLTDIEFQEKIKTLIKKRVKLDKDEINSKVNSLNEILNELSKKLITVMDKSSISKEKLNQIKNELQKNCKDIDFEKLKRKLAHIANSLEVEATSLTDKIQKENDLISNLQKRMHRLEIALEKAKRESKIDFLTKLLSKRTMEQELTVAESAYKRYGIEYSLVFFDLDNFKMINDTFGHNAGDSILKELGKILSKNRREVDLVGRFGGEEFLAILPKTNQKGAITFAENIRKAIENHNFLYKDERIFVTISAGIASRVDFTSKEETLQNADSMLYSSKNAGRNMVSPSVI
jgi:diguanylate cyclase (GGDEF)-like protein